METGSSFLSGGIWLNVLDYRQESIISAYIEPWVTLSLHLLSCKHNTGGWKWASQISHSF